MLTIHPHTSHRLQPLDKSVYGSFKSSYSRAIDGWLRSNPGKMVTIYEIPSLVTEAQLSAMTQRNILSGFQSTGIFPFNRGLFTDADFAPANPTDREIVEVNHMQQPTRQTDIASEMNVANTIAVPTARGETDPHTPQPGTSTMSAIRAFAPKVGDPDVPMPRATEVAKFPRRINNF